jgi:valyl-tRNA synthetase
LELSKTFEPKSAEERWYREWIDQGYFTAHPEKKGTPDPKTGEDYFSIVIPPPNVTGQLHLGHALNVTLQDVIVRTRRMQGRNTLWVPGTDHAGIATQNVVEREIAKEGLNRHQMGRAAFEERVWKWRAAYGGRILHQLRMLGASCDWTREHFTLDPDLSRAVNEVFVRLHRDGLIYRDQQLINWCPRCETALSDLEVEHRDTDGHLYYIRYPLVDGTGSITVATTRPETMLGDTAVAVSPDDSRFKAMAGKRLRLPLIGREIEVIADTAVDPQFGTGAVKITPAHDFNDFTIGRRHGLAEISVMDTRGKMSTEAGPYKSLSIKEAREAVVNDLKAQGLLEKIEPHRHAVGACSRCDTTVEPLLSFQWFVKIAPLAEKAIAAVREGKTRFHPKFWENTYFGWLENVHDWCISRQLWWGHRIPAWRCARCEHFTVAAERPARCEKCEGTDLVQEEDVLDTWFSSALWPFSTLGWPQETADLKRYYPTSLLITGFDIIFFWVARMMMMGLYCLDDVPFRDVYITPLVRDQHGKKMTKSRGNVVDPLVIMEDYGTDAVRFTLAQLAVQGRDLILADDRLAASKAFANKIWNAARFVMMNLKDAPEPIASVDIGKLGLAERWVLDRLNEAARSVNDAVDTYQFNVAALAIYQFIWHEFCDWYIELSKESLRAGGERQAAARYVLVRCFDQLLRLLHPFMPFISEEIWQTIRPYIDERELEAHVAIAKFPRAGDDMLSEHEREAMNHGIAATEAINSLRSLLGFHPGQRVTVLIKPLTGEVGNSRDAKSAQDFAAELSQWRPYATTMAKAENLDVLAQGAERPAGMVTTVLEWAEISVKAAEGFDFEKARGVLRKKLAEVSAHHEQHLRRLSNPDFQAKAAEAMKLQIEQRAEELGGQRKLLEAQLQLLGGAA